MFTYEQYWILIMIRGLELFLYPQQLPKITIFSNPESTFSIVFIIDTIVLIFQQQMQSGLGSLQ